MKYFLFSIKYKKFFSTLLTVGALVTCYLLLHTAHASAQDISLGVYPPIIQINATPPTGLKQPLTISNLSDNPVSVAISFKPFTQADTEDGQVMYFDSSHSVGADPFIFQRIQILDGDNPVTSVDLAPKEQKTLTLRIGIAQDEPASDYYFSILFTANSPQIGQDSSSSLAGSIASNVLLSIGPQDKTTGYVEDFSSPWFVQYGPLPFVVKVANLSHHFIVPKGQILIKNMYNQIIGKVDLLPVNILAGTSRYIPDTSIVNPQSQFNRDQSSIVNLPTAVWPEKFLFGPYKATLVIALSPDGPVFSRSIYFFAMPLQYIIGFFIFCIIVSVIIVRVRKRIGW